MTSEGIADDRFVEYLAWLVTRDQEFMATYYDAILPRYFEAPELRWFFDKAKTFYSDNQGLITAEVLEILLKAEPEHVKINRSIVMGYYEQAPEPSESMRRFMFKQAREWFKRRVLYSTIDNAQDMIEEGRVDEATALLTSTAVSLAKVGGADQGVGLLTGLDDFFKGMKENYDPDLSNAIGCGLKPLDFIMRGGVRPGELSLMMGGPGSGKSQSLCYFTRNAFLAGHNVLYFTLEMSDLLVRQRIWAGLIDINTTEMETDLAGTEAAVKRMAEQLSHEPVGEILVKSFPTAGASVDDLVAYMDGVAANGFVPDLIVIDYGDLLTATRRFGERRDELAAVYQDIRGMGQMMGTGIWSATQLNREGTEKGHPKLSHVSDSWDKVKIADYVFAFGQSDLQRERKEMDIFGLKVRNNEAGDPIQTTYNFGQAMFYER
jgi:replicative DNA helicase